LKEVLAFAAGGRFSIKIDVAGERIEAQRTK